MSETRVFSLPAAAYVLAKGAKLLRCEPNATPGRADFIFEDPQSNVRALSQQFSQGCDVSARDFYRALQDVRFAVKRTLNGGER